MSEFQITAGLSACMCHCFGALCALCTRVAQAGETRKERISSGQCKIAQSTV